MFRRLVGVALFCVVAANGQRSDGLFNVRRYGASGNGVTLDTTCIAKAIDDCAKSGGGTVHFPAGTYLTGTVHLKDNVTPWIDSGATLLGSKDLADYQTPIPGQRWFAALIVATGVRNVGIVGRGVIDGNRVFDPKGEERMRGPHAAIFHDSRQITVRDISFRDAANYALILRSCEGATIDGMTAMGGWDGINMHDTRDVTISNCRLFTGDDSLAGAYWENVTVSNCVLNSSCNAFRAGGRNVLIDNCLIYGPGKYEHRTSHRHNTESGFQILPHNSKPRPALKVTAGGPVDNLVISNVTMVNARSPIFIAYGSDAAYGEGSLGIGRLLIRNLSVTGAGRTPLYISGNIERPRQVSGDERCPHHVCRWRERARGARSRPEQPSLLAAKCRIA